LIVLDASALVELLLGTPRGLAVAESLENDEKSVHVPHLADVEVAHVLRRLVTLKAIDDTLAGQAIDELQNLPLVRHGHDAMLDRIWALRRNATAYDAAYLALAEVLGATLLTCDRRLARSSATTVRVEVI
jgi:predicted nucleic acid-binding protein